MFYSISWYFIQITIELHILGPVVKFYILVIYQVRKFPVLFTALRTWLENNKAFLKHVSFFRPRFHHTDVPACPRSEAPWARVEGQWGRPWLRPRRGAVVPAVRDTLQDTHTAAGSHGHARQPDGPQCPLPHQQQQQQFSGDSGRGHSCLQLSNHNWAAGDWLLQHCSSEPQLANSTPRGGREGGREGGRSGG